MSSRVKGYVGNCMATSLRLLPEDVYIEEIPEDAIRRDATLIDDELFEKSLLIMRLPRELGGKRYDVILIPVEDKP